MMRPLRTRIGRLFTRDGIRGPILTLLSGSVLTMGLGQLSLPLLTRLYTPAAFGVADYFVMIMSVLITVASLRYEDALMVPEDEDDAGHLLWLALLLVLGSTVLLGALIAGTTLPHRLLAWLQADAVAPWLWLVPPTLLFMRVTKVAETWLARGKAFRTITAGDVANKVALVGTRLGAGVAGLGAGGLIGGFTLAHVVSSGFYGGTLLRPRAGGARLPTPSLDLRRLRRLARRFRRFPLFSMPSALLNALVTRLPVLFLPFYFDLTTLGYFGRAFTVLAVPLSLIGGAVAHVFFVHAAEAHRAGTLATLTQSIYGRLVLVGLFPTLALLLAGPDLFDFVFGDPWREAGRYVQYLAPWLFLAAVASPLTRLFDVLERQRTDLTLSVILFAAQALALIVGGLSGRVMLTMLLIGVVGALTRVLHVAVLLRLAGVGLREGFTPYRRYALPCLAGLLPAALVLPLGLPWLTTLAVAAGGAGYAAFALRTDGLFTRPSGS